MHALILAGGEGSRLRGDGIPVPKAFVELGGQPLLFRLAETLLALEYGSVTAMVRGSALDAAGPAAGGDGLVRIRRCETPSSLHTLALGLQLVPPGPVLCVMVDTVMRAADWSVLSAQGREALRRGADGCVAVTPWIEDERPLYVVARSGEPVLAFQDQPAALVTGGAYFLSSRVRSLAPRVLALGVSRMRGFLRWLVEHGYRIDTAEVPRIVDLDRGSDLAAAARWLEESGVS